MFVSIVSVCIQVLVELRDTVSTQTPPHLSRIIHTDLITAEGGCWAKRRRQGIEPQAPPNHDCLLTDGALILATTNTHGYGEGPCKAYTSYSTYCIASTCRCNESTDILWWLVNDWSLSHKLTREPPGASTVLLYWASLANELIKEGARKSGTRRMTTTPIAD